MRDLLQVALRVHRVRQHPAGGHRAAQHLRDHAAARLPAFQGLDHRRAVVLDPVHTERPTVDKHHDEAARPDRGHDRRHELRLHLGSYPIATSQYSSTALYQISYHIQ